MNSSLFANALNQSPERKQNNARPPSRGDDHLPLEFVLDHVPDRLAGPTQTATLPDSRLALGWAQPLPLALFGQ